jgi:hypothetical protein
MPLRQRSGVRFRLLGVRKFHARGSPRVAAHQRQAARLQITRREEPSNGLDAFPEQLTCGTLTKESNTFSKIKPIS